MLAWKGKFVHPVTLDLSHLSFDCPAVSPKPLLDAVDKKRTSHIPFSLAANRRRLTPSLSDDPGIWCFACSRYVGEARLLLHLQALGLIPAAETTEWFIDER
jgi:hypothetical protein